MASLISDLKMAAVAPENRVSDLLRRALLITNELGLDEFREWIHKELNGYTEEEVEAGVLPPYRMLRAIVQGFNPYYGWKPIIFENPEAKEAYSKMPIPFGISRIEDFGAKSLAFEFVEPTYSELRKSVSKSAGFEVDIRRFLDGTSYRGIVDAVRNQILDWAMSLEEAGVVGEGNTFTSEEKVSARSSPSIHFDYVANVTVIGDVTDQARVDIQQNAPFSGEQLDTLPRLLDEIELLKDKLGAQDTQLGMLDTHLKEIREEISAAEPDTGKARRAIKSVIKIAEAATGGIIASGIATRLSQFL